MEIHELATQIEDRLKTHEYNSERRAQWLNDEIQKLKRGDKMSETVNDRVNVHLGGADGGMAAIAPLLAAQGNNQNNLWPILLLALLGRGNGGLFGGGGENVSGLNNLQGTIESGNIMQALGDIKASVPLAESQVQLALAGVQNDINNQSQAQTLQLLNQNFVGQLANQQGFCTTQREIAESACSTKQVVVDEAEKTRALIQSIDKANDSRLISAQAAEIIELRNEGRRQAGENDIRINMIQNTNQLQSQQQQQQQALNQVVGLFPALFSQINRANQDIVNLGTMTASGTQASTNTNVR